MAVHNAWKNKFIYVSFEFPINTCDAGLEGHETITMAETKLLYQKNGEA